MTPAAELLEVLKDEEKALRSRRFEALADIQKKKEYLISGLDLKTSPDALEKIRQQAHENEKVLTVVLQAVRGLRARLTEYGKAAQAVGYTQEGGRMSCDDGIPAQRV